MNEKRMFRKLVLAGIREDMANRIMYSILPSLADPSQVALTGGVVDFKALKKAVSGRLNAIKEGIKIITQEVKYFNSPEEISKYNSLLINKQFEEALTKAIEIFSNEIGWSNSYGGKAWENIARTVRQIYRYSKSLDTAVQQGNKDQEIDLMKKLIVELNVFDGLSHNSSEITKNIVHNQMALNKDDQQTNYKEIQNEFNKLKRIMNSKELDDHNEVFKQIEPTLTQSGDINQYKDWITKLRSNPVYKKENPQTAVQLAKIEIKKGLLRRIPSLNIIRDNLKRLSNNNPMGVNDHDIMIEVSKFLSSLGIVKDDFKFLLEDFSESHAEILNLQEAEENFKKIIKALDDSYNKITKLYEDASDSQKDDEELNPFYLDKIVSLINGVTFYLDSLT